MNKKTNRIILSILIIISCILGILTFQNYKNIYKTNREKNAIQKINPTIKSFQEREKIISTQDSELQKLIYKKEIFREPYDNFLINILLPSLNIRKDPITNKINTNLFGAEYIEKNRFSDIALIEYRTNYFQSNNRLIDVDNVTIGDIEELTGTVSIPVSITFSAPTRRSFMFLVDKVTLTSNKKNIETILELFATIRQKTTLTTGISKGEFFNKRIFENGQSPSNEQITDGIRTYANCPIGESIEKCFFIFREKIRSIPSIAYTLGDITNKDSLAKTLKTIISTLPPIITIKEFTFDTATSNTKSSFKGKITFNVAGRNISQQDREAIQQQLGLKCGVKNLTVSEGVTIGKNALQNLSQNSNFSITQSNNIMQAVTLLQNKISDSAKSPYKQTIDVFETYRILQNLQLCK